MDSLGLTRSGGDPGDEEPDDKKDSKPKAGSAGGEGAHKGFSNNVKEQARKESRGNCVFCGTKTNNQPGTNRSEIDHAIPSY